MPHSPHPGAPRQFGPIAGLSGLINPPGQLAAEAPPAHGLPADREARVAARQSFVALKLAFLDALAALPGGHRVEWLRTQVRAAEDPSDLWLLRGPVFQLLDASDPALQPRRRALRRGLDTVFPALDLASGFASF